MSNSTYTNRHGRPSHHVGRRVSSSEDPGPRGRGATAPTRIPAKGWKDIVYRVVSEIGDDRVMLVAAGVTYYLLLAFVPALTALVSVFGLFADPSTVAQSVSALKGVIPGGGVDILNEQLQRLTEQGDTTLGLTFMVSLAVALWSTNAGMKALFDAMNIAYDETETRSFFRLTAVSLLFTLLFIIASVAMIVVTVALPTLFAFVPLGDEVELVIRIVSYILLAAFALGGICILYRYGPDRDNAKWRWVTPGAIAAALLIAVTSVAFSYYVSNFGSYNATYGSLGALIGFLTWIWISMTLLILGAEINAEMEHQTARDTTVGTSEPIGTRGAEMADNVGPAAGKAGVDAHSDGPGLGPEGRRDGGSAPSFAAAPRRTQPGLSQLAIMVPLALVAGLILRRE